METGIMEVRKIQNFAFRSAENISAKNAKKDDEITQKNGKFSSNVNKLDTDYIDPLMKWPVRGLAYMNEIGVAISEVQMHLVAHLRELFGNAFLDG